MDVLIVVDPDANRSEYVAEMLSLWGCSFSRLVESEALAKIEGASAAVVPPGVAPDRDSAVSFVAQGGYLVLIAPSREMLQRLDMDYAAHYGDNGEVAYLRQVIPLLDAFSHCDLPVLGRRIQPIPESVEVELPAEAIVWAYLYENDQYINDRPAIWTVPVGRGRVTVFAYDLIECYRDLRQGRPRFAGWRPPGEFHCRPANLFGPDWSSQYHATALPLADFHPMLLSRLIERSVDWPVPRFWQLPGTHRSAVVISGDEDGGDPSFNEEICAFLDTLDARMVIYIIPQRTRSTREHVQQLIQAGHGFSVHPYPMSAGQSEVDPSGDFLKQIERCVTDFRERYGLQTRSVVNHRIFWTAGYADIPKLWERLGIEMDLNYGASVIARGYGFGHPPGILPISFMDEQFKRINVLQHVRAIGDDTYLSKMVFSRRATPEMFETYCEALISQALEPLGIPVGTCFHPVNYHRFAGEATRRFLLRARSHGAALMSDTEWLDFWQMRRTWRLTNRASDGSQFGFGFAGEKPSDRLSVTMPTRHDGKTISAIRIEGRQAETSAVGSFGQERTLVVLPDGVDRVELEVTYA